MSEEREKERKWRKDLEKLEERKSKMKRKKAEEMLKSEREKGVRFERKVRESCSESWIKR